MLPNGKVLVAAGFGPPGGFADDSAELYDPDTGTWSETGSLTTARHEHTATLLPDGRVLVAGGATSDTVQEELYDPASGTWTATPRLVEERFRHTATLLPDGKVLPGCCRDS